MFPGKSSASAIIGAQGARQNGQVGGSLSPSKKRGRPPGTKNRVKPVKVTSSSADASISGAGAPSGGLARSSSVGSVSHLVPYWKDEDVPLQNISDEINRLRDGGVPVQAHGEPGNAGVDLNENLAGSAAPGSAPAPAGPADPEASGKSAKSADYK